MKVFIFRYIYISVKFKYTTHRICGEKFEFGEIAGFHVLVLCLLFLGWPFFQNPFAWDGEADGGGVYVHWLLLQVGPGSSLVDLQQIPMVVGDVKCGSDYIVIITRSAENIHISVCVVLLFRTV